MTIVNVDIVSITNRDCQCRYNIDSVSGLTDGLMEFGYGRTRGGMVDGKCRNFCGALVCWDERIAKFKVGPIRPVCPVWSASNSKGQT